MPTSTVIVGSAVGLHARLASIIAEAVGNLDAHATLALSCCAARQSSPALRSGRAFTCFSTVERRPLSRTSGRGEASAAGGRSRAALAVVLLGLGITSLSMAPSAVRAVGARLGQVSLDQCRRAADVALAATSPAAARDAGPRGAG